MANLTRPTLIEESDENPIETSEPARDEIELRAYYRYLERGGENGCDLDDWLAAEMELRSNAGSKLPAAA